MRAALRGGLSPLAAATGSDFRPFSFRARTP